MRFRDGKQRTGSQQSQHHGSTGSLPSKQMAMGGSTGFVEQKNFFHRETRDSSNAPPRAETKDGPGLEIRHDAAPFSNYAGFVNEKRAGLMHQKSHQNFFNPASANKNDGSGINTPTSGNHSLKKQFSATGTFFNNNSHGAQTTNEQPIPQDSALNDQNLQPQFIGQTNIDVKMLFKQNQHQVTSQIKLDPISGTNQKIQQLTILDINKMIHEVSADEESESQKLPL